MKQSYRIALGLLSFLGMPAVHLGCEAEYRQSQPLSKPLPTLNPSAKPPDAMLPQGPPCPEPDRRCEHPITFPYGGESTVELRGNFAPDGWSVGIPMVLKGQLWTAMLSVPWNTSIQYKFVVNQKDWKTDPTNANKTDDGYGGSNSLLGPGICGPWTCIPKPALRFVILGDFGVATYGGAHIGNEASVASMIQRFEPEFIVTLGDNNYPDGLESTIDTNIGQFYHRFIYPYKGKYGAGASENRFFPTLGNHDWNSGSIQAYLDYFELPGNERYYDFVRGPVHFFIVDGEWQEADGNKVDSIQANWLKQGLAASTATYKIVTMHRPPYSSGYHGSTPVSQWPYGDWGADLVLAGHDHCYERLKINGTSYIVNGLGGASSYTFTKEPVSGSELRWTGGFGATLAEVSEDGSVLSLQTINTQGMMIDNYAIAGF